MNSCKTFSRKYPLLLAVLSVVFMFALLKLMKLVPDGPMNFAITEAIMAVAVFGVTLLFMGKEKISFSTKGLRYAFHVLRGYFIFLLFMTALLVPFFIFADMILQTEPTYQLVPFINITIACLFVGLVEEFVFRGLMFGGLLQKLGNSKKSVILASLISGLVFGVLHVLGDILAGDVSNMTAVITASFKTIQCAIFGVILAFIYYKTRNLFACAVIHSLDDFLVMVATGAGSTPTQSYVSSTNIAQHVIIYGIFTLILVPALIRSIKDIKAGEAIPFDEDFLPREVEFERKQKKRAKKEKGAK